MKRFMFFIFLSTSICFAHNKGDIECGDFNFDGMEDYRIFIMYNGRKTEWSHFLFDSKLEKHVPCKDLDILWNPTFNSTNKTVFTYANGGHAGSIYTAETYIWNEGELKLMELISQGWNSEKDLYHKITLKRGNDEMELHEVELIDAGEDFRRKNIEPKNK
ncbi:hypothetical protein P4C99_19405 [Pontiellaceae bacterium B1224]|nr:hypothetical protein [Pontiellaceae bacterium B1224]